MDTTSGHHRAGKKPISPLPRRFSSNFSYLPHRRDTHVMPILSGNVRDFTGSAIDGAELWIHPEQPTTTATMLLADKPIRVDLGSNGSFEADIQGRHLYRVEVLYRDEDRSRMGRSWWSQPFRMPMDDSSVEDAFGVPPRNGMVLVLQSNPRSGSGLTAEYVLNESTGDLFQRRDL